MTIISKVEFKKTDLFVKNQSSFTTNINFVKKLIHKCTNILKL